MNAYLIQDKVKNMINKDVWVSDCCGAEVVCYKCSKPQKKHNDRVRRQAVDDFKKKLLDEFDREMSPPKYHVRGDFNLLEIKQIVERVRKEVQP